MKFFYYTCKKNQQKLHHILLFLLTNIHDFHEFLFTSSRWPKDYLSTPPACENFRVTDFEFNVTHKEKKILLGGIIRANSFNVNTSATVIHK